MDSSALLNTLNTQDNLPTQDSHTAQAYYNTLTLLPDPFVYTPPYHSKPKSPMNTQGIVIGENKEIANQRNTIYTDKYGRIQVKIHCFANQELLDQKEESSYSSSFLRVATPIASHHSGFFHIPRVGDEVIISFFR